VWRRARALPRPAPLALAAAVAAAPPLLWRVGSATGEAAGPALGNEAAARALVFGTSLAAAVGGVVVALAAPRLSALGPQLAAVPVGQRAASLALVAIPAVIVGGAATPGMLALLVPIGAAGPAGVPGGLVLAASGLAGAVVGAAAAETARAARARSPLALAAAAVVAVPWLVTRSWPGLGRGGLADLPALAVAGRETTPAALAVTIGTAVLGAIAWLVAAGVPPRHACRRRARERSGLLLPRRAGACAFEAARRVLWRRGEMRAAAAGLALGLAGAVAGLLLDAPPALVLAQAAAAPILAGALAPVAAAGLARRGGHVWSIAPAGTWRPAVAWSAAALLLHALLVAVVVGACVPLAGARAGDAAGALQGATLAGTAGLLAGAVVPWQGDRLGDQLVSLAAFGCAAVLAGGLVAAAASPLGAAGLPPVAAAVATTAALAAGGATGLRCRLDGAARC
jgi:hypothetical protein